MSKHCCYGKSNKTWHNNNGKKAQNLVAFIVNPFSSLKLPFLFELWTIFKFSYGKKVSGKLFANSIAAVGLLHARNYFPTKQKQTNKQTTIEKPRTLYNKRANDSYLLECVANQSIFVLCCRRSKNWKYIFTLLRI